MTSFGHGFSDCTVEPFGTGANGVVIVGEAPGAEEVEHGQPFYPGAPAGSILERAIRRLGLRRESFMITNTVPSRPPANYLEGAPYEAAAIAWGRPYLDRAIHDYQPRCILALGNVATRATTGLAGPKLGISSLTGFVMPSVWPGIPVVPCFHPAFMRRGAMSHFGLLLRSIGLALKVARDRTQPIIPTPDSPPSGYVLYPTVSQAEEFVREAERSRYLAYDIETPYSTTEDSAEEAEGEQTIKSIQFSIHAGTGYFFPWREGFIESAKRLLSSTAIKLGWNTWKFDNNILRAAGVQVRGENHDLMWAFHHLQPDLPRGLQFAAAQLGWQWPWKHLDQAKPQFYGIVDVDVLMWMVGA